MSSASIKRIIPCKKKQLIEMVLDIEKYPEFVPWCLEGKINEKKENENTIEMKGDLNGEIDCPLGVFQRTKFLETVEK